MDDKELFLKRLQSRLKDSIENQEIPSEQQFALIESSIDSLLQTGQISVKAVEQHDQSIEELTKELMEIQKKIIERYKKTYDGILNL